MGELYPEVIDPALDDDNEPSCSAIEALQHQECFVNALVAQHALALLARLFRYGQISHHGGFVDIASSRSVPLAVDPMLWRRVRTDGSYLSASDVRVHFGLGSSAAVSAVVVQWPDGQRERWTGVSGDRVLTLRRGTGQR